MNKSKKYKYFRKNRHNKHKTRKIQSGGFKFKTPSFKIPSLKNPFSKSPPSSGTDSKPLLTPPQNEVKKKPFFSGFTRNKNPEGAEKKPQNEGEKKSFFSRFTRKNNPDEGEKKSWNPFTRKKKPVDDGNGEIELQPMKNSLQTQQMAMSQEHNTNPNKENPNKESPNKDSPQQKLPDKDPQKGHDPKAEKELGTNHDNQKQENKGTHDNSGAGAGAGAEPVESREQSPSGSTRNKMTAEERKAALAKADELEKIANTHPNLEIQNELRAKAARLRSIAQEHPDPDVVLIPKIAKNGFLGWLSSFFKKSQQNLPIEQAMVAYTDMAPGIIEESKENAKLINDVNKTLRNRVIELINKISRESNISNVTLQSGGSGEEETNIYNYLTPEEKDEMDYLLERLRDNTKLSNEFINDPSLLAHAQPTGNLAAADSIFGSQPPPPKTIKPSKPAKQLKQPPPPPGQQPPGQQQPGQLPPGAQQAAQQAAQQHAEQSKPQAGQQPPKPPGGPPNKPLPPPPPKPPGGPPNKPLPPPPPPPPKPSSVLSSVIPNSLKGGGEDNGNNKTRKNRQYIHEIKENRTQLFNKEMEIINSIRNFKHGHNEHGEHGKNKPENIQKKFIKVIKRS
jgi:hypothetical protein